MTVIRAIVVTALCFAVSMSAQAHPHVWVTMKTELVYAPDGKITGVRQAWSFDDMYSSFALQGVSSDRVGYYTREELAPLAKENVESLKEHDYYISVIADGIKTPLHDQLADYRFEFKDGVLTLHFMLPFTQPVKAKQLKIEIYDHSGFVSFAFDQQAPVRLTGAPQCKLNFAMPGETNSTDGKALGRVSAGNKVMAWGEQFANKILVTCP